MNQLIRRMFGSIWSGMATGAVLATAVLAPVVVEAQADEPVKVSVESQKPGQTNQWSSANAATAGETLRYIVNYQNVGNAEQKRVVIKSSLPAGTTLVAGSTTLYNEDNNAGVKVGNDAIAGEGIVIGDYQPGANAYVIFEAKLPEAAKLSCGDNKLTSTGSIIPQNDRAYTASAVTTVNRDCTPQSANTQQPTYSCDLLALSKGDGRKLTAKLSYTAKDGASLKTVTYDFGDGSQTFVTDKTTVEHVYAKDGTYKVTATLLVSAGGDQKVTSGACAQTVSFATPTTPAPAAPAAPAAPDAGASDLPSTGPGNIFVIFAAATALGFAGHKLLLRRFSR